MIALIENGDEIEIDINNGTANLLVPDEVLEEREPLFMEWYSLTKENIDLYEQS